MGFGQIHLSEHFCDTSGTKVFRYNGGPTVPETTVKLMNTKL